jgi:hypothetical protein
MINPLSNNENISPEIAFIRGGDYNEFPCKSGVYYLKNVAIKPTGTSHTFNDPWFSIKWDQAYPGLQQECELSAEIYFCCRNPAGAGEQYAGKIVLATSKQYSYWEDCVLPDGTAGKRIVFQQFFLQDDLNIDNVLSNYQSTLGIGFNDTWNIDGMCAPGNGTRDDAVRMALNMFLRTNTNFKFTKITEAAINANGEKITTPATWFYGTPTVGTNDVGVYVSDACRTQGPCEPEGSRKEKDPTRICIEILTKEDATTLTKATVGRSGDKLSLDFLSRKGLTGYDFVNSKLTGVTVSPESLYGNSDGIPEVSGKTALIRRIPNGEPIFNKERTQWESVGNCQEQEVEYGIKVQEYLETRRRLKFCYRKYPDGTIDIQYEAVVDSNGNIIEDTNPGIPTTEPYNRPTGNTRQSNLPECMCPTDLDQRYLDTKLKAALCNIKRLNPSTNQNQSLNNIKEKIGYFETTYDCFGFTPPSQNPIRGIPVLEYDLESVEWVLKDSCSCEEILIADLYCVLDGQRKDPNPIIKKNVSDQRTWVRHVKSRKSKSSNCLDEPDMGVYFPFDPKRDIVVGKRKQITKGLFNKQESMLCYLTSSTQTSENKKYYYDVKDCDNCIREPYYSLSYGNIDGLGSTDVEDETLNKTYSDTIYSQYQLICNDYGHFAGTGKVFPKFSFVSESVSIESDDIYAINFYRNGLSDRLDPGNFQINLAYLSGSFYANSVHTGSNVKVGSSSIMTFVDDSTVYDEAIACDGGNLISYNIVSGSLDDGIYEGASVNTYGKVYPQLGIVIFHPKRLNELLGFNTVTGSNVDGDNAFKLFTSISGAAAPFGSRTDSYYMRARNITYRTTTHYFVRLYPQRFNYTNNPTFVTGSKNELLYKCFIDDPQTYITTVGLYNNERQLLAVAKLSRPVNKNFDKDLLIKIRLNW